MQAVGYDSPPIVSGITVVDLTRVLSGSNCTMSLGDPGAHVVRVQLAGRGDDAHVWVPCFLAGESSFRHELGLTTLEVQRLRPLEVI